jgi:hypothetical protein
VGLHTDPRPIGVFDSGVGGLTVLAELRRRLPAESTIYLGDNARAPYGPRTADEVRAFTLESVAWLLAQDVKLLVLACNTATAQALPLVRQVAACRCSAWCGRRRGGRGLDARRPRRRDPARRSPPGAYVAAVGEADPRLVTQFACRAGADGRGRSSSPARSPRAPCAVPRRAFAADGGSTPSSSAAPTIRCCAADRTDRGTGVAVVDSAFTTALAAEDLLDALGGRTPGDGVARTGS